MQKSFNQSTQFIKSFVRYTWFKSPMIYKVSPIFEHAHPIIIEVMFSFPKFVWAGKYQLISSIHSWDTADFRVPRPKRLHPFSTTNIHIKVTFGFPEFLSTHQKSVYSFLKYNLLLCPETRVVKRIFDYALSNIFQSTFNFHESVSTCKKSSFFITLF